MFTFNRIVTFVAIFLAAAFVYEVLTWGITLKQMFGGH